jgi:hypothetical protein
LVSLYTPVAADIDSFIEVLVILYGVRQDIDEAQIPSVFSPTSGKYGMRGQYSCSVPSI